MLDADPLIGAPLNYSRCFGESSFDYASQRIFSLTSSETNAKEVDKRGRFVAAHEFGHGVTGVLMTGVKKGWRAHLTLSTACTFMLGAAACLTFQQLRAQSPGNPSSPFTATEVKFYDHPERGRVFKETTVFALRGDGSLSTVVRRESLQPDPRETIQEAIHRKIADVGQRRDVVVDEVTHSITTAPLTESAATRIIDHPFGPCPPTGEGVKIDTELLLGAYQGYAVLGVSKISEHANLVVEKSMLVAPDLNCLPVRSQTTSRTEDGQIVARTVAEVVSIIPGEPSPDLFKIPANYTERMPSEVLQEWARIRSPSCLECDLKTGQLWDDAHLKRKALSPQ